MSTEATLLGSPSPWSRRGVVAGVILLDNPVGAFVNPLKSALFLFAMGLLFCLAPARQVLVRSMTGPARWLGWLLLIMGISAACSRGHWYLLAQGMALWAGFAVLVFVVRDVFWSYGGHYLRGLELLGVVLGGVALLQGLGWDWIYRSANSSRAVAMSGNTNAFAAIAAPLLAVVVARQLTRPSWRPLPMLSMVFLAASLMLAQSRGGWLAALVGVTVAILATKSQWTVRSLLQRLAPSLAGLAIGLGTTILQPTHPTADKTPLTRSSDSVRWAVIESTWNACRDAPILGHGPGQFRVEYPRFRQQQEAETPSLGVTSMVDPPSQYAAVDRQRRRVRRSNHCDIVRPRSAVASDADTESAPYR